MSQENVPSGLNSDQIITFILGEGRSNPQQRAKNLRILIPEFMTLMKNPDANKNWENDNGKFVNDINIGYAYTSFTRLNPEEQLHMIQKMEAEATELEATPS